MAVQPGWSVAARKSVPLVAGCLCILILFFRFPSSFTNPQFWAEDGVIFWHQSIDHGWRSFLEAYAGYFHLGPRIVATIASFFDPASAPILFFTGYVILVFWSAATACASVCDWRLGLLLGASLMLPPLGGGEVLGNLTNVQWILAPTLALLLLSPGWTVNRVAFAAVASLSGPFSVLLAPVALWRLLHARDAVSATVLLGGIVQALALVFSHSFTGPPTEGTAFHLFWIIVYRPFLYSVVCALLGLWLFTQFHHHHMRRMRFVLSYLAVVVLAVTFHKFLTSPTALDSELAGSRYFYIPRVALIWCAISLIFVGRRQAMLAIAFLLSMQVASAAQFRKAPLPDSDWARHYRSGAKQIDISPEGWRVPIPGR